MSSERISKETAELCPLPPYSWYWKPASVILERSTVKSNLDKVALNEPLMENLKKESIKNPFFVSILGGHLLEVSACELYMK